MAQRLHPLHPSRARGHLVGTARIILVRPEHAGNVGAVARIVRNTGLAGLDLVAPGDWRTLECWRAAWNAHEVLEQARVFPDLAAAAAGAAMVVAFSGRRGDSVPVRDVREVAEEAAALGPDQEVRLVFGPEASGLTLAELALCGARASIPSHPDQPSLNVSHAVMVAAYELFRARRRPPPETGPRRATWDEKARLVELMRTGLQAIGALPPAQAGARMEEWTALVQRLDLTRRELRLIEHVSRKMARAGRR